MAQVVDRVLDMFPPSRRQPSGASLNLLLLTGVPTPVTRPRQSTKRMILISRLLLKLVYEKQRHRKPAHPRLSKRHEKSTRHILAQATPNRIQHKLQVRSPFLRSRSMTWNHWKLMLSSLSTKPWSKYKLRVGGICKVILLLRNCTIRPVVFVLSWQ
jgi:hypothetical protein